MNKFSFFLSFVYNSRFITWNSTVFKQLLLKVKTDFLLDNSTVSKIEGKRVLINYRGFILSGFVLKHAVADLIQVVADAV